MHFENPFAGIAQVVEHATENRSVPSASLGPGTTALHKGEAKPRVVQYRLAGRSYNEIHHLLGVPKSTIALWLKDVALSDELRRRLYDRSRSAGTQALIARNQRQTVLAQQRAEAGKAKAASAVGALSPRELFLVGSALYWAEGRRQEGRNGNRLSFCNADPCAIRLMMRFFREVVGIPESRFRVHVVLHPGLDVEAARRYWAEVTSLPLTPAIKTFVGLSRASRGRRPRRLPYGTCHVCVGDVTKFHQVMGWVRGLQQVSIALPHRS